MDYVELIKKLVDIDTDPEEEYELLHNIGKGSYGQVFKAVQKKTGIFLALKLIPLNQFDKIETCIKELEILASCQSKYIVKFFSAYYKEDHLWIAMEYCGSGSVKDNIRIIQKAFNEDMISSILFPVLKGIHYLHKNKMIHRDIKAANILLNYKGDVKLADFGVSTKIMKTYESKESVIGSPFWMSPEILNNQKYTSKTDIWSVGITAIEMAEMQPPYSKYYMWMALQKLKEKPPRGLTHSEQWSKEFNDFISCCLILDPEERPTAKELLDHPFIKKGSQNQKLIFDFVIEHRNLIQQLQQDNQSLSPQKKEEDIQKHKDYEQEDAMQTVVIKKESHEENHPQSDLKEFVKRYKEVNEEIEREKEINQLQIEHNEKRAGMREVEIILLNDFGIKAKDAEATLKALEIQQEQEIKQLKNKYESMIEDIQKYQELREKTFQQEEYFQSLGLSIKDIKKGRLCSTKRRQLIFEFISSLNFNYIMENQRESLNYLTQSHHFFDCDASEISILNPFLQDQQKEQMNNSQKDQKNLKFLKKKKSFNKEAHSTHQSEDKSFGNSKPSFSKHFEEDKELQNKRESLFSKQGRRKKKFQSDDESDAMDTMGQNILQDYNAIDDTFNLGQVKLKVNYLNVLVVGASHSGKFNFSKFIFEHCFGKNFEIDEEEKLFRPFVHKINNGRRGTRVISIIHSKGYSDEYPIREWYINIKKNLIQRIENYEEIRSFFYREKNLHLENIQDTRIHLCLFFMKSTQISILELMYLQKISKMVNVIPVLCQNNQKKRFNYESVKLDAKRILLQNNIEWFDMQEDDLTFKQFQRKLLAQTTPFLLAVDNQNLIQNSVHSDLEVLVQMLVTPYINTYYYKTELIFFRQIDKIKTKKEIERMKGISKGEINSNVGTFGLAVGIGIVGAICAFKNKLFNQCYPYQIIQTYL